MVNRQQTREQRNELREALLQDFRSGSLQPGDVLPPVRELAKRHGLSLATAQRVLRGLADEGILQLRQGAGAFINQLPEHGSYAFVAVFGNGVGSELAMRAAREGFEGEIARRGGASITITPKTRASRPLFDSIASGELTIGGTFVYPWSGTADLKEEGEIVQSLGHVPNVVLSEDFHKPHFSSAECAWDTIRFDDHEGARMAVRHLWRRGHRLLAFLALHPAEAPDAEFAWSRRREAGFRAALNEFKAEANVFHPASALNSIGHKDQELAAQDASRALIPQLFEEKVKAVVCVNEFALRGLLQSARQARLPESKWPAIIAFDDNAFDSHVLSVISLPWEELGRTAASALWERAFGNNGQRQAPPREILVPMRMMARLSCFENFDAMFVTDSAGSLL